MSHPTDLLLDYTLGELEPTKTRELEAHLRQCGTCRTELKALQSSYVALCESVPTASAPISNWAEIQKRITAGPEPKIISAPVRRIGPWPTLALAASLILAIGGFLWAFQLQQDYKQTQAEQRKVAGWLSRPDVSSVQFVSDQGDRLGSVLTLSDGRALFVMRNPPTKGQVYQAWGMVNGERTSIGLSSRTLLEVPYTGYEFIGTSLEPRGGSSQPTQPLGRVAVPLEPQPESPTDSDSSYNTPANDTYTQESNYGTNTAGENSDYEHNYDTPSDENSSPENNYGN
ncbi:MAG: anti-sigma factor [Trueperaceae bacterium]|nr:anti-sigma factor [Trueperaceae bacterium]